MPELDDIDPTLPAPAVATPARISGREFGEAVAYCVRMVDDWCAGVNDVFKPPPLPWWKRAWRWDAEHHSTVILAAAFVWVAGIVFFLVTGR